MPNIKKLFTEDIVPTLTDFSKNQFVFWNAFKKNISYKTPIKNVLELGIMRIKPSVKKDLPGQSLKTLLILGSVYNVDKHISLDIDDCRNTVEFCKKWVLARGVQPKNHKFVQSNSMDFNVLREFPAGVDLIFLDTNHDDTYPEKLGYKNSGGAGMTYKEICYYAKHLTRNGRLYLHDTKNYYVPRGYGVNTEGAVQRFLDENKNFGFYEHNTNNNGLGEIFRKDSDVAREY